MDFVVGTVLTIGFLGFLFFTYSMVQLWSEHGQWLAKQRMEEAKQSQEFLLSQDQDTRELVRLKLDIERLKADKAAYNTRYDPRHYS